MNLVGCHIGLWKKCQEKGVLRFALPSFMLHLIDYRQQKSDIPENCEYEIKVEISILYIYDGIVSPVQYKPFLPTGFRNVQEVNLRLLGVFPTSSHRIYI